MKEAAESCLGFHQPGKKEWFDDECKEAVQKVIDASKMRMTRARVEEVRQLQRDKKELLRRKKRDFDRRCLDEIEELQSMNESRKFFNAVKFARKKFQPRVAICKAKSGELLCSQSQVLDRWREHFQETLNVGEVCQVSEAPRLYERNDGKDLPEPTLEEVREAIARLKNNKAPGEDGLSAELFKTGCSRLEESIHNIIVQVWREEKMPDEWTIGVICPLHKKGCKLTCSNFRGITLLSSAYKIFSKILSSRLEPHYEDFLHEFQAGFRKGRSTIDQIHCIRQIIQKSDDKNTETLHLLIDFKAAYDSVDREGLWNLMTEFQFPHKMIRLLKATLQKVQSRVKVQGLLSESFETLTGLKQGDELSTKLFNIALEGVCRKARLELNGSIFNKSTQLLAYADDIDIIGRNTRSITEAYSKLELEASRLGLLVNEDKTKLLMVAASDRTKQRVGQHLSVNGKCFEVVQEFKYLGSHINISADVSMEVRKRIHSGYGAFYSLKHLLTSKSLSRGTKVKLYKTLIRVIALYGSETWNSTQADEEALGVFERRILRTIYGPIREGMEYRSRHNEELYQLYQDADIVTVLRTNRLRWAGHVFRRPPDAPVLKVTVSEFMDGKRSRGRPKNTWIGCVEKDARILNIPNWQKLSKNRAGFRESLRAAMGPRAPQPRK
jgi:sorting nexin-29